MKKATLYTDGGARGNPGPAGIGFVLRIAGEEVIKYKKYIGKATNNQAEYRALLAGMQEAKRQAVRELVCFLDSELVVKQLHKIYRMKNAQLRPLFEEIEALAEDFDQVSYKHVRREKNKDADRLVNEALDQQGQ